MNFRSSPLRVTLVSQAKEFEIKVEASAAELCIPLLISFLKKPLKQESSRNHLFEDNISK